MSAEETNVQAELGDGQEQDRNWEGEAREMGWAPKESFRGDPAKWVDAKTYVERGENFIPLLQHTKRELQGRLSGVESDNADLRRQLALANKALEEVKEEGRENTLESATARKEQLYNEIAQAREDNDVRKELSLREELDDVNAQIRTAKAKPAADTSTTQPAPQGYRTGQSPEMDAFLSENEWFGRDQEKSSVAMGIMNSLVTDPATKGLSLSEKFRRVAQRVNQLYGSSNPRRSSPSRVEGGRTDNSGGGSGGGSGRKYDDLPASAKEQCDKQSSRFIGRADAKGNVKYKNIDDYRAEYARSYFAEDWGARHLNS